MSEVIIFTDGGARGNPGPAGAGVVILQLGKVVSAFGKFLGGSLTNNWAEYEALILALHEAKRLGLIDEKVEIRMDSELIVKQMQGLYKVKDKNMKQQHAKVRELLLEFQHVHFKHIPREENSEADALVNEALDTAISQ
jgi:ribonuclease HI